MNLATVSAQGGVSAHRAAEGCDERGFVFYSNYEAARARAR